MLIFIFIGLSILLFHKKISEYLFTLSLFNKIYTLQGIRIQVISFWIICIGMSVLLFYWNKLISESKNIPNNTIINNG